MSKREELFPMFSQEILGRKELFGERKAAAFVRQEGLLEGFAVGMAEERGGEDKTVVAIEGNQVAVKGRVVSG